MAQALQIAPSPFVGSQLQKAACRRPLNNRDAALHCFSSVALLTPCCYKARTSFKDFAKTCHLTQYPRHKSSYRVQAAAGKSGELEKGSDGPPVQLGTAELPEDINLPKLKKLLYQWANSIVTSSALPLPLPLKVDSIDDGVRLAFIRIEGGEISELFNIDVLVTPKAEGERRPMFRVIRDGDLRNQTPPFEPQVMSSLLAALKKAVPMSRGES